ncbi:PEGA domain-containing protein [Hyalangium gracile]|uniref:PEGA domain-containing protein n=1 Tax=Hyalangium gracile TaxID=394092 RepID=UPI001CCAA1ED|nr:PEGA domain-containing protein [Hyalangium gracile]
MSFSRAFVFALVATLVAPPALAQDDLFVPLPNEGKTKPKASKRRPPAKKATAKKSEPAPADDDLFVPIPSNNPSPANNKKPATAKKPPEQAPADDDLVVPIAPTKTEMLVKLGGGIKGARLFVDNKDMGPLPMSAPISIDTGEHTIVVRRPGFADFNRRVTVQQGKPWELPVTLEAVAGVVTVTSDVPGASVAINGQTRGQVPLSSLVLKPGSYEIVVSKEGFEPETKSLSVKAGKDYTVTTSLRPSEKPTAVASSDRPERPVLTPTDSGVDTSPRIPLTDEEPEVSTSSPWYKRWYVWAGVGVLTAAAAGAVVATQGGGAKPLSADTVCNGPCDATINGSGIMRLGGR